MVRHSTAVCFSGSVAGGGAASVSPPTEDMVVHVSPPMDAAGDAAAPAGVAAGDSSPAAGGKTLQPLAGESSLVCFSHPDRVQISVALCEQFPSSEGSTNITTCVPALS